MLQQAIFEAEKSHGSTLCVWLSHHQLATKRLLIQLVEVLYTSLTITAKKYEAI